MGILQLLDSISKTVEDLYVLMLRRSKNLAQALRTLNIVCHAKRPLSITELIFAQSIRNFHTHVDHIDVFPYSENWIKTTCGYLVSVIDGKVYLLHQTVKDFLLDDTQDKLFSAPDPPTPRALLAQICISYLCLEGLMLQTLLRRHNERAKSTKIKSAKFQHYFLNYATTYWIDHFRDIEEELFESDPLKFQAISLYPHSDPNHTTESGRYHNWAPVFWDSVRHMQGFKWERLAFPAKQKQRSDQGQSWLVLHEEYASYNNLHFSAAMGHISIVKHILDTSKHLNKASDYDLMTPLHVAINNGWTNIVKCLLTQSNNRVNSQTRGGFTPLNFAAKRPDSTIANLLLSAPGIQTNLRDKAGYTPLHMVVTHSCDIVKCLSKREGIEVNARDKKGNTPLHIVVQDYGVFGIGVLSCLLNSSGIDVNAQNVYKQTPLHLAATCSESQYLEALLGVFDIKINAQDGTGSSPLHLAINNSDVDVFRKLCENDGTDINLKNNKGRSPLFMAVAGTMLVKTCRQYRWAHYVTTSGQSYRNTTALTGTESCKRCHESLHQAPFGFLPRSRKEVAKTLDIMLQLCSMPQIDLEADWRSLPLDFDALHFALPLLHLTGRLNTWKRQLVEKRFLQNLR